MVILIECKMDTFWKGKLNTEILLVDDIVSEEGQFQYRWGSGEEDL